MKTLLIFLISAATAFARLGESNQQIMLRYGAVQDRTELGTNIWRGTYLFKEYNINCIFFTNTCVSEIVMPLENRKFGDDEREALMKSIGGDGTWIKDSDIEMFSDTWINTTTKARARVDDVILKASHLTVMSPAFIDWALAEQKKKEQSKAAGF
jgi:hypothetical protein